MTLRSFPRFLTTVVAVGALAVLSGCASAPAAPVPTAKPTTQTAAPAPTPQTAAPEPVSATPTCETLVSEGTVQALTEQGWTVETRDFTFGPDVVAGGVQCLWSDFSQASDHGQLYGWAPISADAAVAAQKKLVDQGWVREERDRGVYLTVDPSSALNPDEDGYGMTYLFGDGWVTLADTKQGLILITLPE